MMKGALAAALLCAPAHAGLVTIRYQGVVDTQYSAGVDPLVSVGDQLTLSFAFDTQTQEREPIYDPLQAFAFDTSTPASVFSVTTSRGLEWLASDDVNGTVLIYRKGDEPLFGTQFTRIDADNSPTLMLNTRTGVFYIVQGGFDYGNTTPSLGFSGRLELVELSDVPEPATWALMVAGFSLSGAVTRKARRGSRLSTQPR